MFTQSISNTINHSTNFIDAKTKVYNSPELLLKIFSTLNTRDLVTVSLVCKHWRQIIIIDQERRLYLFPQLNNNSNLLKEYNFIYKNVENFEDADFHLVGERHSSQFHKELCGALITRLGMYHNVIVLVEGSPSMKVITENFDLLMERFYIHPSLKGRISFIGCDAENLETEMGNSTGLHCWLLQQDIECLDKIMELNQKIYEICPDLSNDKLFELSVQNLEIILELTQKLNKINNWQKVVRNELAKGIATEEDAKRTFPKRTSSMAKTLNTIQSMLLQGEFVGKIVLLCGAEHLRIAQKNINVQEYQLDELYQTLSKLKTTVMIPNKIERYLQN